MVLLAKQFGILNQDIELLDSKIIPARKFEIKKIRAMQTKKPKNFKIESNSDFEKILKLNF